MKLMEKRLVQQARQYQKKQKVFIIQVKELLEMFVIDAIQLVNVLDKLHHV
jgi:hypothetical protein